jgi:hypothetical protein
VNRIAVRNFQEAGIDSSNVKESEINGREYFDKGVEFIFWLSEFFRDRKSVV